MEVQMNIYQETPEQLANMYIGFPATEFGGVQEAEVENPLSHEVGVSLSHDDHVCLCVAGQGKQGCDIEPITHRKKQDWMNLLHGFQKPLMLQLLNNGDSADLAGTRVWAAMEALRKATDVMDVKFEVDQREGDSVLFRSTMSDQELYILTFPQILTRGPERVVAMVAEAENAQVEETVTNEPTALIETGGMTDDNVYVYRFPPAFKSYSNLSRTFYFSNYFTLMGKLRGTGLGSEFHEQITKEFATDKWGMVTNHSETRIFDNPRGTDGNQMEVHLWLGDVSGPTNSTAELNFDWYQVLPDGRRERVAFSKQSVTWVKVIDHGVAKPHPFPDYVQKVMEEALMPETPPLPCPLPEKLPEVDFGSEVYSASPVPSARPLLQEETFHTALEDADVVGNIHFSDYFVWQGRVRDSYFYKLAPGYYRGNGDQGEFLCRRSRVEHLREAMPFDRVYVTMSLRAVYERGVSLYFEYFRLNANGEKQKLAYGEHDAVWTKRVEEGKSVSAPLPQEIREALLSARSVAEDFSPKTEILDQYFEPQYDDTALAADD